MQIELERTTLQLARRTIDGTSILGIWEVVICCDDKLQVIIMVFVFFCVIGTITHR